MLSGFWKSQGWCCVLDSARHGNRVNHSFSCSLFLAVVIPTLDEVLFPFYFWFLCPLFHLLCPCRAWHVPGGTPHLSFSVFLGWEILQPFFNNSDISLGCTLTGLRAFTEIQQLPLSFLMGSNSLVLANVQLVCPEQLQRLSLCRNRWVLACLGKEIKTGHVFLSHLLPWRPLSLNCAMEEG